MFSLIAPVLSDFVFLHLWYSAPKFWEILLKYDHLCETSDFAVLVGYFIIL